MSPTPIANPTKLDSKRGRERDRLVALLSTWASGEGPLYRQLADAVEALVVHGELRDGELLPPERRLAHALGTSRSTVVAAYDLLRDRGRVERRQGSGTRVLGPVLATSVGQEFKTEPLFAPGAEIATLLKAIPERLPPLDDILRAWPARALASSLESIEPEGLAELRAVIAARYTGQGLPTTPDAIVVTNGAQQGLSLALAAVCGVGDVVLTEAATWPGLSDVVARQGGRCLGIRMDDGGIDTAELRAAVERLRPVAIALNPHHHNPTGTRLLPHRRREVADIAAEYGVTVIEDRVSAPMAFDGLVEPPLAQHRHDAPIVVVDSLSKTVWPGLRIGWLRGSPDLVRQVRMAKAIDDMFSSIPSQQIAIGVVERLDDLIAQRIEQLAPRADLAYRALTELLPDWSAPRPLGGLVMWPTLPTPTATAFINHAARQGVLVAGAESFSVSPPTNDHIRIPFTAPEAELLSAMERLAAAWDSFDAHEPVAASGGAFI